MTVYGIDRFNTRDGLALAAEGIANVKPANDNLPRERLVGLGNSLWSPPQVDITNAMEVQTASLPLRALHQMVVQAMALISDESDVLREGCVYVVGDVLASAVKIGKAIDPIARLAQLQTGHPNLLFLHRVFWMDRKAADQIEVAAHGNAGFRYTRLQGEWFACNPNEAHEAIEDAIFDLRCMSTYCAMTPLYATKDAA